MEKLSLQTKDALVDVADMISSLRPQIVKAIKELEEQNEVLKKEVETFKEEIEQKTGYIDDLLDDVADLTVLSDALRIERDKLKVDTIEVIPCVLDQDESLLEPAVE